VLHYSTKAKQIEADERRKNISCSLKLENKLAYGLLPDYSTIDLQESCILLYLMESPSRVHFAEI
jgi:hypothetical protein